MLADLIGGSGTSNFIALKTGKEKREINARHDTGSLSHF